MTAELADLRAAHDVIRDYVSDHGLPNDARSLANDLDRAELLTGSVTRLDPVEATASIIQCRTSWRDAEAIAKLLGDAGLLATKEN